MDMGFSKQGQVEVQVCVGTSCYLKGSTKILKGLTEQLRQYDWADQVKLRGAFCCQQCAGGPMVMIGDDVLAGVTLQDIPELLHRAAQQLGQTKV